MSASHKDRFGIFLCLLFLLLMACGAFSGKWGLTFSTPLIGDGSQWHLAVRYGTARVIIAGPNTDMSRGPGGVAVENMPAWRFEWLPTVSVQGSIRLIQIPLRFPALGLMTWMVARSARRHMRVASGVCPRCGKATGRASHCPKCGLQLSTRQA